MRVRLRAAAIVLLLSSVAYFVPRLFVYTPAIGPHMIELLTIAICMLVRCSRRELWQKHLRVIELLIFGMAAVLLAAVMHAELIHCSQRGDVSQLLLAIKSGVRYSFALMFIYGTLVPNTWHLFARRDSVLCDLRTSTV